MHNVGFEMHAGSPHVIAEFSEAVASLFLHIVRCIQGQLSTLLQPTNGDSHLRVYCAVSLIGTD